MALRVKKIEFGTYKGGRFHKSRKNPSMPKLGSGKRFERCVQEVMAKGGAYDPQAVCAARGIRKYGKKRMLKLARKGKVRHRHNPNGMKPYPEAHRIGLNVRASGIHSRSAALKEFEAWYDYRSHEIDHAYPKAEFKREFIRGWGPPKRRNHRSARARNKVKRPRTSRKAPNYKKKKNRRS